MHTVKLCTDLVENQNVLVLQRMRDDPLKLQSVIEARGYRPIAESSTAWGGAGNRQRDPAAELLHELVHDPFDE